MKTLFLILFLLLPALVHAGVSVCVSYGLDANGSASPTVEIYSLDANGNVLPFVYGALTPSGRLTTDGILIIKGIPHYCGKAGADALFKYAMLTNQ
jgi:hypothetical protein